MFSSSDHCSGSTIDHSIARSCQALNLRISLVSPPNPTETSAYDESLHDFYAPRPRPRHRSTKPVSVDCLVPVDAAISNARSCVEISNSWPDVHYAKGNAECRDECRDGIGISIPPSCYKLNTTKSGLPRFAGWVFAVSLLGWCPTLTMSDNEQAEIAKWRELCASMDFDKPSRAGAA